MKAYKTFQRICILASALILVFSGSVYATGANGSGGAHGEAKGNQLLDLSELQGSKKLVPLAIAGVQETLQQIAKRLPGFAVQMKGALDKEWYLTTKPLLSCPGGDSLLDVKKITVACQNKFEVRIDKKWFETPPDISKGDLENELYVQYIGRDPIQALKIKQQATIIHELLRNLRLTKISTSELEQGLRYVVRKIVPIVPDKGDLQRFVAKADFGYYSTGEFVYERQAYIQEVKQELLKLYSQLLDLKRMAFEINEKIKQLNAGSLQRDRQQLWDAHKKSLDSIVANGKARAFGLSQAEFVRQIDEQSAAYNSADSILRAELSRRRNAIEQPGLDLQQRMTRDLERIAKHPLTVALIKDDCGFDSVKTMIDRMIADLAFPDYWIKDEQIQWGSFASRLDGMPTWERVESRIKANATYILTCEPHK